MIQTIPGSNIPVRTGYAELLQRYWQLEQFNKANELIMVVKWPGIRASQKIDVAKVLLQPFHRRDAGATSRQFSKEIITQLQEQGVRRNRGMQSPGALHLANFGLLRWGEKQR